MVVKLRDDQAVAICRMRDALTVLDWPEMATPSDPLTNARALAAASGRVPAPGPADDQQLALSYYQITNQKRSQA